MRDQCSGGNETEGPEGGDLARRLLLDAVAQLDRHVLSPCRGALSRESQSSASCPRPLLRARAEALRGGALVSTRVGDYELTVGQDLSIGYTADDRTDVELFITETFTFRVLEEKL